VRSLRPSLRTAGFVVGLGLVVAWASLSLRIGTRGDTIHNMSNILYGRPMVFGDDSSAIHPFYNRILFPSLLMAFSRGVGLLSEGQWYILLRIASCIFALAAFALACRRGLQAAPGRLELATALMALSMIASFTFPWEDPTDVIDAGAQALAVLAALGGRFGLCLAIALVFAMNRESAAYAAITWFILASVRPWGRRVTESVAIGTASYALAVVVRLLISQTGTLNWLPLAHNIEALLDALRPFTFVNWLGVLLAVTVLLTCCIDFGRPLARRFATLAALFTGPAVLFGYVNDLRVFLPCAVMLCFAVASGKET
jgi:hypothetical protein